MKSTKKFKVGDKIRIAETAPLDKRGKLGTITNIYLNGAMIEINKNWFTAVKFENLEKI
jgi:hypothetical protein